jgi:hypothetical protein
MHNEGPSTTFMFASRRDSLSSLQAGSYEAHAAAAVEAAFKV